MREFCRNMLGALVDVGQSTVLWGVVIPTLVFVVLVMKVCRLGSLEDCLR